MASCLARLVSSLVGAIKQRPVVGNCTVGGTLCGGSDALAQQIEGKKETFSLNLDQSRFLSAGLIGIFFGGFVYPYAYARLDAVWKGVHFSSVLKKSIVEIATVGVFVNSISMSTRGLLVGRNGDDVVQHVASEMPTVTFNDARVWLPYNLFAFSFVPVHIRPSTTSAMEAMWQTYISLRSHDYKVNDTQDKVLAASAASTQ